MGAHFTKTNMDFAQKLPFYQIPILPWKNSKNFWNSHSLFFMHEQKLQAPHSGGAKKVSPKLLEKGSCCSSSSAPTFPQFPSAQNCVLLVRGVRTSTVSSGTGRATDPAISDLLGDTFCASVPIRMRGVLSVGYSPKSQTAGLRSCIRPLWAAF